MSGLEAIAPMLSVVGSLASAFMGSKGAPSAPAMLAPPPPPAAAPIPPAPATPPPENTVSASADVDAEASRQQASKRRQALNAKSDSLLGDAMNTSSGNTGGKQLLGQ